MAKKRANGNGNGHDRSEDLLEKILTELKGLTHIQTGHGKQLREVIQRLGHVESGMNLLNERFDRLLVQTGERIVRIESRLERLEASR
jgi:hypothetical protein